MSRGAATPSEYGVAWPKSAGKDPLLARASHYKRNRKHWQRLRLPCAVCGQSIDYDGPNLIGGRQNPRALVVGHVSPGITLKRMGWSEAMINATANTRPECRRCSNEQVRSWVGRCNAPTPKPRSGSELPTVDRW
jgi:hypothetical protein